MEDAASEADLTARLESGTNKHAGEFEGDLRICLAVSQMAGLSRQEVSAASLFGNASKKATRFESNGGLVYAAVVLAGKTLISGHSLTGFCWDVTGLGPQHANISSRSGVKMVPTR